MKNLSFCLYVIVLSLFMVITRNTFATPLATPSPSATTAPTPTPIECYITSTVIDALTGAPIAGATISTDTGGYTATTGPDGSYTIADIAPGTYVLTASATGYDSSSQAVTVVAGAPTVANFTLVPTVPTPPTSPTPIVTPTPCEVESIAVSPTSLMLKRKKSGEVTVTVGCPDETVTATINATGKKRISVSPTSTATDVNGETTFTITAKRVGNARVTFMAGSLRKGLIVKVKK